MTGYERMRDTAFRFCCFALLGLYLLAPGTRAQDDCSAELAIIDERIAGKPDDYNKQMALMLRNSLQQMCPFTDAASRAAMLESLDELYPTKSPEELKAERRARTDQLKAERDARMTAAAAAAPTRDAVLDGPPSGRSIAAQYVDRQEVMGNLVLRDWDIRDGNLRILYTTGPQLPQLKLPDWQSYVYVIEVTPAGEARQTLLTSKQASDQEALALRRGFDEVFYLRRSGKPGEPPLFERWSITAKRRLTAVDASELATDIDGRNYRGLHFGMATSDGNLMFDSADGGDRQPNHLAWFKLTTEGRTLGAGDYQTGSDRIGPWTWFETDNGGAGLLAHVLTLTDTGLSSGELAHFDAAGLGDGVTATVSSETRFYLIDGSGRSAQESPALERMIMITPKTGPSGSGSMQELTAAMAASQEAQTAAAKRYRAERSIDSLNIGYRIVPMIAPLGDGYVAMVTQTADRSLQPPIHGQYLVRVGYQGIQQEIYLNPFAQQLDAKFTVFEPEQAGGGFYLLANPDRGNGRVIRFDHSGKPVAWAETAGPGRFGFDRSTLVSDAGGVWLFGDFWPDGAAKPVVWIERFRF